MEEKTADWSPRKETSKPNPMQQTVSSMAPHKKVHRPTKTKEGPSSLNEITLGTLLGIVNAERRKKYLSLWSHNMKTSMAPDVNLYGGAVYSRKCCQNVTKVRMGDHFCLKWNNHQENLTGIMTKLLDEQKFVDVSLVCEMKTFKAHQTVLSACSPYFEQVLEENPHPHPIIILRDVKESEMTALLQYMYRGEVSVRDDELSAFLHTARALKVRGLSESKKEGAAQSRDEVLQSSTVTQIETVTPQKRPRTSVRINEQEILEKHHSEPQSFAAAPGVCKSSPKPSGNTLVPSVMNYSESSSEMQYSETSTSTQTIKQEVENISVPNEESSAMSHLANLEPRSDQCHKLGDWGFDYGHPLENRSYQTQKVELPKVPIPMTYNFSSQLQGSSIPALYPCNSKGKPKKDQPGTSYDAKPKAEFALSPSFGPNHTVSVIRNAENSDANSQSSGIQRKGGRFRPGWMENYSWLQYDECLNTMYCKTCRKWSSSVPDIRTSFVEGNGNFRLEIVNHHHKSKAHKLCMAKEEESIPRLDPIINNEDNN